MNDTEFKSFYAAHAKPLWAYVYRLTKDNALSDDIVQESFVRFLNRDLTFLKESQKKSYVYQTATNIFKDYLRKNKKNVSWDEVDDSSSMTIQEPKDTMDFEKVFDQLPAPHRSLLWMAYVENYDHEEIADILKIKTYSVKVLLYRAKQRLIVALKELGITGEM